MPSRHTTCHAEHPSQGRFPPSGAPPPPGTVIRVCFLNIGGFKLTQSENSRDRNMISTDSLDLAATWFELELEVGSPRLNTSYGKFARRLKGIISDVKKRGGDKTLWRCEKQKVEEVHQFSAQRNPHLSTQVCFDSRSMRSMIKICDDFRTSERKSSAATPARYVLLLVTYILHTTCSLHTTYYIHTYYNSHC